MANWVLPVFVVVAISSFIPPSACFTLDNQFGINLADFAKALRTRDVEQSKLSEETTADKLVDIIIETLDSDNDGQVALSEVRNKTVEYLRAVLRHHNQIIPEATGYIMTIAILIDSDDSAVLDRNELQRAVSTLVSEAGDVAAAKFLLLAYQVRVTEGGEYDSGTWFEENAVENVITGLDSNNDGSVSNEELMSLQDTRAFEWLQSTLIQKANEADQDGDDLLDTAEIRRWVELLWEEGGYAVRQLVYYGQITRRLGRHIAEQWAANMY